MKTNLLLTILVVAIIIAAAVMTRDDPFDRALYVAGRIYIRERGISAEVYTHEAESIDGMSTLWNGGKVTTKADMSTVQVGDMADLYTVEGEHLVLECIAIRSGPAWLMEPHGDVLVINGRWVYRFTRL